MMCPRCQAKVRGWPSGFRQWFRGRRQCKHCGAWLEPVCPALLGGLGGVVAGCFVIAARYSFADMWLGMLVMIPSCWVVLWVIKRVFGKWRVIPDESRDSKRVRRWSWVFSISLTVALLAILGLYVNANLQIRAMQGVAFDDNDPAKSSELVTQIGDSMMPRSRAFLAVSVAGMVAAGFASIMKSIARKAQKDQSAD